MWKEIPKFKRDIFKNTRWYFLKLEKETRFSIDRDWIFRSAIFHKREAFKEVRVENWREFLTLDKVWIDFKKKK